MKQHTPTTAFSEEIVKVIDKHKPNIDFEAEFIEDITAAVEKMMLEVIGEDEKLDMTGSYEGVQRHNISYDRNELRAEQHQRLLTKLYGDKQ